MISFFLLGCFVTAVAAIIFLISLIKHGEFLFGPFIAMLIGINYLLITVVQMARHKKDK